MLPVLQTERLSMLPWREQDIDAVHALLFDRAIRRYLCDDVALSREQAAEFVHRHLQTVAGNDVGFWALHHEPRDTMIGFCGFLFTDGEASGHKGDLELVYALLPAWWGRGLAAESAQAALSYLWRATRFTRVFARADPPNVKSLAVMQRVGMRHHSSTHSLLSYVLDKPSAP